LKLKLVTHAIVLPVSLDDCEKQKYAELFWYMQVVHAPATASRGVQYTAMHLYMHMDKINVPILPVPQELTKGVQSMQQNTAAPQQLLVVYPPVLHVGPPHAKIDPVPRTPEQHPVRTSQG
jgi:hypothetical protein